jgi:predicted DNA binding CopG/RHH family protein
MTSIRLDPEIVEALKKRADTLGVGWQTVLKMIVTRYVSSEL